MAKSKRNKPLKINASFEDAMKMLSGYRPAKEDIFNSKEEAEAELAEYRPWIRQTYIDIRDKSQPKIKWKVVDIIAAPVDDNDHARFVMWKIIPDEKSKWQLRVVLKSDNSSKTEYLIDFKEFYKLID